jgi:hypothetical protein
MKRGPVLLKALLPAALACDNGWLATTGKLIANHA